jgi:ferredoxin--NADP+ reductase
LYRILSRRKLALGIHRFKVDAAAVAARARPGQFVIIRLDERGERIPLTIADWDRDEGSLTLVVMETGMTTHRLSRLKAGSSLADFTGPLGKPTEIEKFGTVVLVAGGFAVATITPIARAMKAAGNRVISIVGARGKERLFWQDRLAAVSDRMIITTDDGSRGRRGVVTEPLREILESGEKIDRVIAIGPPVMMKFCAQTTQPFNVKTIVSLNPIMIDGIGMCGVCRVSIGGVTRFACIDGPDFDGHQVDWDLFIARQNTYLDEERLSLDRWRCQHGGQSCGGDES